MNTGNKQYPNFEINIKTRILLITIICVTIVTSVNSYAINMIDSHRLPLEDMRVIAYSTSFAQRFNLPLPKPPFETFDGLEAIEFSIEKRKPWSDKVSSNYRLYLDGNLLIDYPEDGNSGNSNLLVSKAHFFGQTKEQVMKWEKSDRVYFNEKRTQYARTVILATMDYVFGRHGASDPLWYEEYRRELFDGLDYVHVYGYGRPFDKYKKEGVGIWLKKMYVNNYRTIINIDGKQFYKLRLPDGFYNKVIEMQGVAEKYNNSINDNE